MTSRTVGKINTTRRDDRLGPAVFAVTAEAGSLCSDVAGFLSGGNLWAVAHKSLAPLVIVVLRLGSLSGWPWR